MKKIFTALLLCSSMGISAFEYCATASWGYAGNVTGGGNVTPTLVKNESELINALKNSNRVIIITQDITVSTQISVEKNNITLMALPGKRLINNTLTKEGSGILYIKSSNVILRNLTFEGPGAYDIDGKDNLTLDGAKNIWVDHCDFQDGMDGNYDTKGNSDNITASWCRFRYLKEPHAGGSGGSDDHRFTNLVGSGSTDKPEDGIYNITWAYCWWDEGCKQRMTRCRNSELHFLNCYWNSSVADYYVGPENASCYFEGCTFAGKANSASKIWSPFKAKIDGVNYESVNYCTFVNCTGNLPSNSSTPVSAPSYSYDQLTPATAKKYVINGSCGAGATLNVTTSGEVSSSCDNGGSDPEIPIPGENCCIDLSLGEAPTVANGGIPDAYNSLLLTAHLEKGKWDQGFINFGGNADYITFDFSAFSATIKNVEFDVTIPSWTAEKNTIAYHWNSDANTKYTIKSAATETVKLTAPVNAKSFTIQRSAGTSTRISQLCFQMESTATRLEQTQINNAAQKVLRHGQLLILRNGKTYSVLGLNQ